MDERQLLKLKAEIDSAEREAAQLEGQRNYLLQQLKEQFSCPSVEVAEKKLARMDEEIKQKDKALTAVLVEINEKYNG